jgi:hypothetical protein
MCLLLSEIEQAVFAYGASLEPDGLTLAQAEEVTRRSARMIGVLQSVMALASARAASSPDSSRRAGFRSAEERLAHDAKISPSTARRVITAGKRLANQPEVAKAALSGELYFEQAAIVAEGVEADPSTASGLITRAGSGSLLELSDEVARIKAAATDPEQRRRDLVRRRSLRQWSDRDGACHTQLVGEPLDGARLSVLLDPIRRRLALLRQHSERRDSFEALGYDALFGLVDVAAGRSGELDLDELLELGLFPQLGDVALRRRERVADTPATEGGEPNPAAPAAAEAAAPTATERASDAPAQVRDDSGFAGESPKGRADTEAVVTEPGQGERFAEVPDAKAGGEHSSDAHAGDSGETGRLATTKPSLAGDDPPGSTADTVFSTTSSGSTRAVSPSAAPPAEPAQPARPSTRRARRRAGSPARIMVRVDLDTLLRGVAVEGELCEIAGFGPVPVSVITDLLAQDNAFVVGVLTKARQLVGVYHHRRRPTAYQSSALDFLFPSCAVAGCNARAGLQTDHRVDWSRTHYTVFDLLDRLCWFHHGLKTEKNWALVKGRGKRAFVPPEDPRHPRHVDQPEHPRQPAAAAAARGDAPGRR